jgi:glycosyltransferase involved in cell wall biosynthesis
MRILIVSPFAPSPTWGSGTRVYQFIRFLSVSNDVTLLTYMEPSDGDKISALKSFCRVVHAIPRTTTRSRKRIGQLSSVLSATSHKWRSMYSAELQQALEDLSGWEPFDVVQLESSQLARLKIDPRSVLVVDEHNIEYELYFRVYQLERSPARRAYNWLEYVKFKREEIRSWRHAAACLTTSEREEAIIRGIVPNLAVWTAPNGVDTDYFRPHAQPPQPETIVLTGLMKYRPNVDAAKFFVREIMPRLLRVRPNLRFYIVGGEPPEEVTRLAGPNVVVTGSVPDVRPYVYDAAVFVVPLRMGSGTRLKVLEGLSMQKPMVSTALGCEGIDVRHGEHLLIADDPAAFAEATLELLENRDKAHQIAAQGRQLVERRYQWSQIVKDVEGFYEALLANRTAFAG